ncbi:hypothetical protein NEOLEDRAFT_580913 [Neolentinus lepideus HHB14362 ss-1]|uniref:Uncharacterized protein n=1 Tax=Neolentinus lepideus HHB14362 ss-1 TaxID=1314782 RepID=A0A165QY58_9AGAM|nr:hypothetical protein NEOLEDRAFT_580913 [Neolentinus lepideus HHB14362 ss-1]
MFSDSRSSHSKISCSSIFVPLEKSQQLLSYDIGLPAVLLSYNRNRYQLITVPSRLSCRVSLLFSDFVSFSYVISIKNPSFRDFIDPPNLTLDWVLLLGPIGPVGEVFLSLVFFSRRVRSSPRLMVSSLSCLATESRSSYDLCRRLSLAVFNVVVDATTRRLWDTACSSSLLIAVLSRDWTRVGWAVGVREGADEVAGER